MSQEKPKVFIPREVRLWMYSIAIAACAALVVYGIITIEEGGVWLAIIAAILAVPSGVAIDNVPKTE